MVAVVTTRERVRRLEVRLAKIYLGATGTTLSKYDKKRLIQQTERLIRKYKDQIMERDL